MIASKRVFNLNLSRGPCVGVVVQVVYFLQGRELRTTHKLPHHTMSLCFPSVFHSISYEWPVYNNKPFLDKPRKMKDLAEFFTSNCHFL